MWKGFCIPQQTEGSHEKLQIWREKIDNITNTAPLPLFANLITECRVTRLGLMTGFVRIVNFIFTVKCFNYLLFTFIDKLMCNNFCTIMM